MVSSDAGLLGERPGLRIVSFQVVVAGRSYAEHDPTLMKFELENPDLGVTTSCPSPGEYLAALRAVEGECVLLLAPHAALSGAVASARAAASAYAGESQRPVVVVDTRAAAAAYGLICRVAVAWLRQTKDLTLTLSRLRVAAGAVRMYGYVSSVAPLARSGRLKGILARTVDRAGARFMFEVRGDNIQLVGLSRTDDAALDRLACRAARLTQGPVWAVAFSARSCIPATLALERLAGYIPIASSTAYVTGAANLVHGGPTMLGFAIAPTAGTRLAIAE